LRDLNSLVGRHHANDPLDFGPSLDARSAHEERDLTTLQAELDQLAQDRRAVDAL
jgi:hypothetical protein